MTPEGYVKEDIREILKKYHVAYFMPKMSTYGSRGTADFVCCYYGLYLEVEAKADKTRKQSAMQIYNEKKIKEAGGAYLLIHGGNLKDLRQWLEEHTPKETGTHETYDKGLERDRSFS